MDDYRISIISEPILGVSNRIGFCCIWENPILRASLQIRQLLTGRFTHEIKGHSRLSPAHAIWSTIRYGRGLEGREEGDCNLIPACS